jgi:hypothetical protein
MYFGECGYSWFCKATKLCFAHATPLFGVWPWPMEKKKRVTHPLSTAFIDALRALLGPAHVAVALGVKNRGNIIRG